MIGWGVGLSLELAVAVLAGMLLIAAGTLSAFGLGLNQGPAFYCLLWAVATPLAYRQLERHLLPHWRA